MIGTILRINWINLTRDRGALGLTFILPIVFFSVFAFIYNNMGSSGTSRVKVVLVDEDQSEASRRFADALKNEISLRVSTAPEKTPDQPWTRDSGIDQVRTGEFPVAVILPRGFGATFGSFGGDSVPAEMYYDQSNLIAPQMVTGLMQKSAMTAVPDLMITRGLENFDRFKDVTGGLTDQQRAAIDNWLPRLREQTDAKKAADSSEAGTGSSGSSGGFTGPVSVKAASVFSDDQAERSSLIAYSAAGIGVMFLLFSMSGAGGTLLEEEESGALERLLISNIGMTRILLAKWLFIAVMGALQVTLMFVWGALVFKLDLFTPKHMAGFAVMTIVTAAAAAGFGMMLATACRSRGQLGGVSTIVILLMSALGGSMIPAIFMPEIVQKVGLFTFNGQALNGYHKVFWYSIAADSFVESLIRLWPQVSVLAGLSVAFLIIARLLARRWETV